MKWSAQVVLLLGGLLCLLVLAAFVASPPPAQIHDQVDAAVVNFAADRSQVLLPSDCARITWAVEGIREVYIDGEGTVGQGERTVCPWDTRASLRVVFQDGAEKIYTLPIRVLSYNGVFWLLVVAGTGCLLAAIRQADDPRLVSIRRRIDTLLAASRTAIVRLAGTLARRPYVIVGAITCVGAALRLAHLTDFSLVLDEAALWQIARGNVGDVIRQNAAMNSAPPLFPLLVNGWVLAGRSELWLRLLPALASIAAIPAMYTLAKRLFDRNTGYFAAALLAVAAAQVEYAQYLREYSLTVLLTSLAIYGFWEMRKQSGRWGVWVAVWAISLFTQYGLFFVIGALDLMLLAEAAYRRDRPRLVRLLRLQVILGLAAAGAYFVALRFQLAGGSSASWYRLFYWNGLPVSLGNYVVSGWNGLFSIAFGANSMLGVFAALGIVALLLHRRIILIMCGLPILLALTAGLLGYYPYLGIRQMLFLTPVLVLLACGGFSYLLTLKEQKPLRLLAAVMVVAGIAGALSGVGNFYARAGYEHMRPVVQALEAAYQPGDTIVVIPYAYPAFDYYYVSADPVRAAYVVQTPGNDATDFSGQLDAARAAAGRVWVLMNCCEDQLQEYFSAHGDESPPPFATSTNVSLYLLAA